MQLKDFSFLLNKKKTVHNALTHTQRECLFTFAIFTVLGQYDIKYYGWLIEEFSLLVIPNFVHLMFRI